MTRFSLDREEDDSDDFPDPKRLRTSTTTTNRCLTPPPQDPNRNLLDSIFSDSAEEADVVVDEDVEEEVEEEEYDEEEEEEEEEDEEEGVEIREEEEGVESSQSARSAADGAISVILSDPDVLDCPTCLEPLTVPVFQCENGHVACNCCCSKLKNTCPSCCRPIGYNRCRAIEKVIESIKISCQNLNYGCKETVPYSRKHDHEHVSPCTSFMP